jgi:hypothetical protein
MTTKWVNVESIGSYFESLSDPRPPRVSVPPLATESSVPAAAMLPVAAVITWRPAKILT